MIHWFQCSTYIALYFHIFILLFPLLVCALAGPLLRDLDFSASVLEETDEPLFEGTQEDYQAWVWVSYLRILVFCLVMMSQCQNYIFFFISALLYFKSWIQTKTIVDVCLLCKMKLLVVFCICVQEFGLFITA